MSKTEAARQRSASDNNGNGEIHATRTRKYLTLAAVKVLKHFRPRLSSVLMLTPSTCVKYGPFQHLSEAASMQYILDNTTIPVPKVYCAFERNGTTYIVMSRISGSPIGHEWKQRPEQSKALLLKELEVYIKEMRSLTATNGRRVQAVDGGKLFDSRLVGGVTGFGPFESVADFHSFLRDGTSPSPDHFAEVTELIDRHTAAKPATCFTHGDLSSMNILVRGDHVVGIVDWDTAGWFPEYWEYTTASNVNMYNEFWKPEISKFLDEYPEALRMENLRQKYFGDF